MAKENIDDTVFGVFPIDDVRSEAIEVVGANGNN